MITTFLQVGNLNRFGITKLLGVDDIGVVVCGTTFAFLVAGLDFGLSDAFPLSMFSSNSPYLPFLLLEDLASLSLESSSTTSSKSSSSKALIFATLLVVLFETFDFVFVLVFANLGPF